MPTDPTPEALAAAREIDERYTRIGSRERAEEIAPIIDAAIAEACERAFETAKEVYSTLHPGQCKMYSIGDNCTCFLCLIDEARAALTPKEPDHARRLVAD